MIKKIDMNSLEFQEEFKKTVEFTDQVCSEHNFVYNLNSEHNESIQQGLTRNKLIYGERFCPCFMVIGETPEERLKEDNRLCPCAPALTKEIPDNGTCHCGIFCTSEYVGNQNSEEDEKSITHTSGLTKEQCEELLTHSQLNASQIEQLLEARDIGFVDFLLVDTREWMEWVSNRIKGTDFLIPTTSFNNSLSQIEDKKETPIVLYCYSGSRSAYCQRVMLSRGYKSVSNFDRGIMTYGGETLSGDE